MITHRPQGVNAMIGDQLDCITSRMDPSTLNGTPLEQAALLNCSVNSTWNMQRPDESKDTSSEVEVLVQALSGIARAHMAICMKNNLGFARVKQGAQEALASWGSKSKRTARFDLLDISPDVAEHTAALASGIVTIVNGIHGKIDWSNIKAANEETVLEFLANPRRTGVDIGKDLRPPLQVLVQKYFNVEYSEE